MARLAASAAGRRRRTYRGSGGRVNQSQPTGSGFVMGSHAAQGKSDACFAAFPGLSGLPVGHGKSVIGSLVNGPPRRPSLFDQQLPRPSSSHQ